MAFISWGPDFFGGAAGSMNLQFNQGIEDIKARASFWQYPDFNFGLSTYPGIGSSAMDILCDPRYTIGQMAFSNNNSIFPGFGAGMNMLNPWYNFGTSTQGGGGSTTNNKPTTAEERKLKSENDKIVKLLNNLANTKSCADLSTEDKDEIKAAVKNITSSKDSIKEKNEQLKNLYNDYKNEVKEYILSHETKNSNTKIELGGTTLDTLLNIVGFERADSDVDAKITELHDAIEGISKDNGSLSSSNIVTAMESSNSKYAILDTISSYNTMYKKDGNLAKHLCVKYNSLDKKSKENGRGDELVNFSKNLRTRLVEAANKELESLTDDTVKQTVQKKVDELNKLDAKNTEFADKFNEVYVILRILAARNIGNKLAAEYGKIDSETYNESMLLDSTKNDLDNELGNNSTITSAISLVETTELKKRKEHATRSVPPRANDDSRIEVKIASLTEGGLLKKLDTKETIEGTEYEVYEEEYGTGENGAKKQYVVIEDKIYEVTKNDAGNKEIAEEETKYSKIKSDVGKKKTEAETAKREADEAKQREINEHQDKIKQHLQSNDFTVKKITDSGVTKTLTNGTETKEVHVFEVEAEKRGQVVKAIAWYDPVQNRVQIRLNED